MCPIRLRCLFVSVNITELLNASLQTENKTTFPVKALFQANLSDNTVPGIMSENFNICCIIFPFHWLSILWEETCVKKRNIIQCLQSCLSIGWRRKSLIQIQILSRMMVKIRAVGFTNLTHNEKNQTPIMIFFPEPQHGHDDDEMVETNPICAGANPTVNNTNTTQSTSYNEGKQYKRTSCYTNRCLSYYNHVIIR